jgi:penicillin-binding protein 2
VRSSSVDEVLGTRPDRDRRPIRFIAFAITVVLAFGVLGARIFYLQMVQAPTPAAHAQTDWVVPQAIPATRGLIYDRNGRALVRNVPSYSIKVRPADLPLSRRDEVVTRLAALLGKDPVDINETIDLNPGSNFDLVRVAQDVPETTARVIAESPDRLPGVQVVVESRREYWNGSLFSQIIGYTGPIAPDQLPDLKDTGYLPDDLMGKAGVESVYEEQLRGLYGRELVERDPTGRKIQVLSTLQDPIPGASLRLTIDMEAQSEATRALTWAMKEVGFRRGVVIAMNPQTGEVLALVSLPTYDNNLFATGISNTAFAKLVNDRDQPLLDHAVQAHYAPGSTYKLVTATGGLADRKITDRTRLLTRPYLQLGGTRFREWNGRGWGPCDIYCGFGHSSDTFFFQVAGMLGIDRLAYWAHQYGFGAPTGIDLPGEAPGIVPSNAWKMELNGQEVFPGETYQAGIGQGYDASTPIQLITAYAALANGGRLYRPQVVREIVGPDGTMIRPFEPELIRKLPVKANVLREMRMAARNVVLVRHTYNLVDLPIKIAGKSGTAEFGIRDKKGRLPFSSWFVGFVPRNPRMGSFEGTDSNLVVLAFAYDSRTKGNVATEIVKYFLQLHFDIEKDYRLPDLLQRGNFYQGN